MKDEELKEGCIISQNFLRTIKWWRSISQWPEQQLLGMMMCALTLIAWRFVAPPDLAPLSTAQPSHAPSVALLLLLLPVVAPGFLLYVHTLRRMLGTMDLFRNRVFEISSAMHVIHKDRGLSLSDSAWLYSVSVRDLVGSQLPACVRGAGDAWGSRSHSRSRRAAQPPTARYFSTRDSLQTLPFSFRHGHSAVHNILIEVFQAITDLMMSDKMPKPTEESRIHIAEDFWKMWNFPNCLDATDGKHVQIMVPPGGGSQFNNYKQTFSIVMLAPVNVQYRLTAVYAAVYVNNINGSIFAKLNLGKALEGNKKNSPNDKNVPGTNMRAPHVIIGDKAFPDETCCSLSYPNTQMTNKLDFQILNRRVPENGLGNLEQKFLIYLQRIHGIPEDVDRIVMAMCIPHNYITDHILVERHNEALDGNVLNGPKDKNVIGINMRELHVIVGDEAFPLNTYLSCPYSETQTTVNFELQILNRALSEKAHWHLTKIFRIHSQRIHRMPENVDRIDMAMSIVHNYITHHILLERPNKALEANKLNGPTVENVPGIKIRASHVIVGDEAFLLKTHLSCPHSETQTTIHFDFQISNRVVSEQALWHLAQKFRMYLQTIHRIPDDENRIFMTMDILHKYITHHIELERLNEALEFNKLNGPKDKNVPETNIRESLVIVADRAFPIKIYLPYPYSQTQTTIKFDFQFLNKIVSENTTVHLAHKFLIYLQRIHGITRSVVRIVMRKCVLHNYIADHIVLEQHRGALEVNKLIIPKDKYVPFTNKTALHVIVGDDAFPLKIYLSWTYPETQITINSDFQILNGRVSENKLRQLMQIFRIYLQRIHGIPDDVNRIFMTIDIPHNYITHHIVIERHNEALEFNKMIATKDKNVPPPNMRALHVIVGDEDFSLKIYLSFTYPETEMTINIDFQIWKRWVSNNALRHLTQIFRIYLQRIHGIPEYVHRIFMGMSILHNFITHHIVLERPNEALEVNKWIAPKDKNVPETNMRASHVIVGDEASPLKTYLSCSYPEPQMTINSDFHILNWRVFENTLVHLAQKCRIYLQRIHVLPKEVNRIVMAMCILHNSITDHIVLEQPNEVSEVNKLIGPKDKNVPLANMRALHVIFGDEAFPLKTYHSVTYPETQMTINFDFQILKRSVSDNALRCLSQMFRIYLLRIHGIPEYVHRIVMAMCILHNYITHQIVLEQPNEASEVDKWIAPKDENVPVTNMRASNIIVGDVVFPVKAYLSCTYQKKQTTINFNLQILKRVVSDEALWHLAQKFRIYLQIIHGIPRNVDRIVTRKCILHNYIADHIVLEQHKEALEVNKLIIPKDKYVPFTNNTALHVIVADDAFPLKTYLPWTYPETQITINFDFQILNGRVSENKLRQLMQIFRIYLRRIHVKPEDVDRIVMTMDILHNYITHHIVLERPNEALEFNKMNGPKDKTVPESIMRESLVIVADRAFPIKICLSCPYSETQMTINFDFQFLNKIVSENTTVHLAQKFRIYLQRIHGIPRNADRIVMRKCILHNYIADHIVLEQHKEALEVNKFIVSKDKNVTLTNMRALHVNVGDDAFPLKTYNACSYPETQMAINFDFQILNRRVSDNAVRHLTQIFRIYLQRIHGIPEDMDRIVIAMCVLHNYVTDRIVLERPNEVSVVNTLITPKVKNVPLPNMRALHVIVGDEAIPLKISLSFTYSETQMTINIEFQILNRWVSDNSLRHLTQIFRIYLQKIHGFPEYMHRTIMAMSILHNYIRHNIVLERPNEALEVNKWIAPKDENVPETNMRASQVIVGDVVFPVKTYLSCSYPEPQMTINFDFQILNRRVFENTLVHLAQKFRIYLQSPKDMYRIEKAMCILYNYITDHIVFEPFNELSEVNKLIGPKDKNVPLANMRVLHVIVGDEAFPLKTYLSFTYTETQMTINFDFQILKRSVSETALRHMTQIFRFYLQRIHGISQYVHRNVMAMCILHNYITHHIVLERPNEALEVNKLIAPKEKNVPETNMRESLVIVADRAFPIKIYLSFSYSETQTTNNFDFQFLNRIDSENTTVHLAQKFRIYLQRIRGISINMDRIVMRKCILHNYIAEHIVLEQQKEVSEVNKLIIPKDKNVPLTNMRALHVIFGDEAFPLKTYLSFTYPETQMTINIDFHILKRSVSDNALSIYLQRMHGIPEYMHRIVRAMCILHNYITHHIVLEQPNEPLEFNKWIAPKGKNVPVTNMRTSHVVVGEEAFPLKTYLSCSYPETQILNNCDFQILNGRFSETALWHLAHKFRIYLQRIHGIPEDVNRIVMAMCILHNYITDPIVLEQCNEAFQGYKMNDPKDRNVPGTNMKTSHVIVVDEAFPLKTYLSCPYSETQTTINFDFQILNRRFSEKALWHLAQKFRIYLQRNHGIPEDVDRIVMAMCILHNYITDHIVLERPDEAVGVNKLNAPKDKNVPETNMRTLHDIVGDEIFPFSTYLSCPYSETQTTNNFDFHIWHRIVSENSLGHMAQKFRLYLQRIHGISENVDRIVMAMCILHNYITSHCA